MLRSKFFLLSVILGLTSYLLAISKVEVNSTISISVLLILFCSFRLTCFSACIENLHIVIFYIFQMIWLAVTPLASEVLSTSALNREFGNYIANISLLLIGISLLAFELGLKIGEITKPKKIELEILKWRQLKNLHLISIFLSISLLVLTGQFRLLFSSVTEFTDNIFSKSDSLAYGAILNALIRIPIWLICLVMLTKTFDNVRNRKYVCLALLTQFIINNPVIGTRFWMGVMYCSLVLVYLASRNRLRWLGYFPIICISFIISFYPSADFFRYDSETRRKVWSFVNPITALSSSGNFDAFAQLEASVAYVAANGHMLGKQLVTDLFFFIPRSMWSSKSLDSGQILGKWQGLGNTNLSAPLQAELYLDGGIGLVLLGFIFLGIFYRKVSLQMKSNSSYLPIMIVMSFYQLVILRGSLLQSMGSTFVIFVFLKFFLIKKRIEINYGQ